MKKLLYVAASIVSLMVGIIYVQTSFSQKSGRKPKAEIYQTDIRVQAAQYIDDFHSIKLSPEQEKIKDEALSSIPAPCCKDYSIATCCCPCNLAKSVWGLSHNLIVKRKFNVQQLKQAVSEWIQSMNPDGFTGDVCYTQGCNRPFRKNGCGGMYEGNIL